MSSPRVHEDLPERIKAEVEHKFLEALLIEAKREERTLESKLKALDPSRDWRREGLPDLDAALANVPPGNPTVAQLAVSRQRAGYLRDRHGVLLDRAARRVAMRARLALGLDRYVRTNAGDRFGLDKLARCLKQGR